MALPATEDFNGSNYVQLTTHNASWTLNNGDFDLYSNALACDAASTWNMAHWNADSFNNNQYAEATLVTLSNGIWIGLAVRCHATQHTGYAFVLEDNQASLWRWDNDSPTGIDTANSHSLVGTETIRLDPPCRGEWPPVCSDHSRPKFSQ